MKSVKLPKINQIALIAFDFGETLVTLSPPREKLFLKASRGLGLKLNPAKVKEAYEETDKKLHFSSLKNNTQKKREAFYFRYHHELCRILKISEFLEELHPALRQIFKKERRWKLYPDALLALKKLKAKKVKLAIFANWDKELLALAKKNKIAHFFESIQSSEALSLEKPDPKFFAQALKNMKVSLKEGIVLYVGNDYALDILPSAKAGFLPVWINRSSRNPKVRTSYFRSLHQFTRQLL